MFHRWLSRRAARPARVPSPSLRPCLEALEDRLTPTPMAPAQALAAPAAAAAAPAPQLGINGNHPPPPSSHTGTTTTFVPPNLTSHPPRPTNSSQAFFQLVSDEFYLTIDSVFATVDAALGIKNPSLTSQIQQLQTDIKNNPLNGTPQGNEAEFLGFALAVEVFASL